MLDLVGNEIVKVRDCVNASLGSALGDFSARFDKLEKLMGDLIRVVPVASEAVPPVVVAELIPPGPVSLEYEPTIPDHRIKSAVVQEIVNTHSSPNEIIHCLIFKGYKIQARLPKNVKFIRTNIFKVFAHSGGVPDPSVDQCYFCDGLPVVDNKHKKVIHSHGFRQFGLVQLLTQVVNLNTVSLVINFGDFSPSCRILNPFKLFWSVLWFPVVMLHLILLPTMNILLFIEVSLSCLVLVKFLKLLR
jgi:hypothetical protein